MNNAASKYEHEGFLRVGTSACTRSTEFSSRSAINMSISTPPFACNDIFDLPSHLSAAKAQHQMQSRLFLDVVVRQCTAVIQLLPGEDQALLVRRDALFVLNLSLDPM